MSDRSDTYLGHPWCMSDPTNPSHYKSHPSGVECITITEHFNFNLGSAIKYIWRAGLKTKDPLEDLRKAEWYIRREIDRLEKSLAVDRAITHPDSGSTAPSRTGS